MASDPIAIHTPSGAIIHSTHEADLDCPGLPPAACHGHVVPQLATQPLLSIGQLCDAGCDVAFTATNVTIMHNNNIILAGHRTPVTKLWQLNIQPPAKHAANAAMGTAKPADLVAFAHAAMFSPALSTLAEALRRGHLTAFAGLTLERLQQHPPQSIAMHKGHMDQDQMNARSTKQALTADDEPYPDQDVEQAPTHACYTALMEPTGQTYMDLTGKFVAASSNGNNYILIIYDYDSNAIIAVPLKNRKAESILTAYKTGHARLCAKGLRPKLQRLDNEAS